MSVLSRRYSITGSIWAKSQVPAEDPAPHLSEYVSTEKPAEVILLKSAPAFSIIFMHDMSFIQEDEWIGEYPCKRHDIVKIFAKMTFLTSN